MLAFAVSGHLKLLTLEQKIVPLKGPKKIQVL